MSTWRAALAVFGTYPIFAACSGPAMPSYEPDEAPARTHQDGGKTSSPPRSTPAASAPLARDVGIDEIAVYQGTRVTIARGDGSVTERPMPIVAGRDALVRVFVSPRGAKSTHARGELVLTRGDETLATLEEVVDVSGPSREEEPATTFDFDVKGELLSPETSLSVRLLDDGAPAMAPARSDARYPRDGTALPLGAERATDKLRIVIVPVRYGADGSSRLPDTSGPVLDAVRKRMLEFYPVPDVELTVRAPIDFEKPITADGNGWDELLQRVTQVRLTDDADADAYYYGAVAPASSLSQFCPRDCVLGLSNFGDAAEDAAQRASVGALYPQDRAIDTVPHEIGHAHGREHAPCGNAASSDATYPYQGAVIGNWGYSIVTKSLKRPTLFDQMSYCTPAWQSDYTYRALFDRVREVAAMRAPSQARDEGSGAQSRAVRMLRVAADGAVSWAGGPFRTSATLRGAPQPVAFVDAQGRVVASRVAHAYRTSHGTGGTLIVPYDERSDAARRIRVSLARPSIIMERVARRFGSHVEVDVN